MADPESDPSVSVSTGEVRVGKAFEADRFPVPAIAFQIESLADDPIRIRLVDQIPESFAMEGVGFHPDYDSDNWTAYRDHRVAYERTIDPGESILTVYGIRIDDPSEAEAFLGEPTIELIETDTSPDTGDVLGRETTQPVRDALSGEGGNGLSNLGSDPDSESLLGDADSDAPETEPREMADDPDAAIRDRDEDVTRVDATDATDDEEETEDDQETVPSAAAAETLDPRSGDGAAAAADGAAAAADGATADESGSEDGPSGSVEAESVAATLAAEIRAGRVDDDDLAVLREAFEAEVPGSVDARIGRLQSQVEDLLAYSDALADFLDENGTAEEVVGEVNEEVSDLNDRVADLEESLSAADADRAELGDEVAAVADDLETLSDRIDDDLDALDETVERLDDRLAAVESFEDDIEEIRAELDELRTFRDRLNDAFGTAEE